MWQGWTHTGFASIDVLKASEEFPPADNMLAEAEKCFNRALAISNTYHPALCNLGNIAMLKKKYDKAVNLYGRVLTIDGKNTSALVNLARALYESKRYDQASVNYRKTLSMNPGIASRYGYLDCSAGKVRAASSADLHELNAWSY